MLLSSESSSGDSGDSDNDSDLEGSAVQQTDTDGDHSMAFPAGGELPTLRKQLDFLFAQPQFSQRTTDLISAVVELQTDMDGRSEYDDDEDFQTRQDQFARYLRYYLDMSAPRTVSDRTRKLGNCKLLEQNFGQAITVLFSRSTGSTATAPKPATEPTDRFGRRIKFWAMAAVLLVDVTDDHLAQELGVDETTWGAYSKPGDVGVIAADIVHAVETESATQWLSDAIQGCDRYGRQRITVLRLNVLLAENNNSQKAVYEGLLHVSKGAWDKFWNVGNGNGKALHAAQPTGHSHLLHKWHNGETADYITAAYTALQHAAVGQKRKARENDATRQAAKRLHGSSGQVPALQPPNVSTLEKVAKSCHTNMLLWSERARMASQGKLRGDYKALGAQRKRDYMGPLTETVLRVIQTISPQLDRDLVADLIRGLETRMTTLRARVRQVCTENALISTCIDQYNAVPKGSSRSSVCERIRLLSMLVVQFKKYKEIRCLPLVPRPDRRLNTRARLHRDSIGPGKPLPILPVNVFSVQISTKQIEDALGFVLDPSRSQYLAHLSTSIDVDGKRINTARIERTQTLGRLYKEYRKLPEFQPSADGTEAAKKPLGETLFFAVAQAATDSQTKAMAALDSQAVRYGTENWDALRLIIGEVSSYPVAQLDSRVLLLAVASAEQFFKRTYMEDHLVATSPILSHCKQHAFGMPPAAGTTGKEANLAKLCSEDLCAQDQCHGHNGPDCKDCLQLDTLLGLVRAGVMRIEASLGETVTPAMQRVLQDWTVRLLQVQVCHRRFMSHVVRGSHEAHAKELLWSCARADQNKICVVMDFKMKVEQQQNRESSVDFYGKRGMILHGIQLSWIRLCLGETEFRLFIQTFDFTTGSSKEDSFLACAMLEKALNIWRQQQPWSEDIQFDVDIFTDGAGCYAGQETRLTLQAAVERANMRVRTLNLGEAGLNKTTLDGHFGTINAELSAAKRTRGKDIISPFDLARILGESDLKNTTVLMVDFDFDKRGVLNGPRSKTFFAGIRTMSSTTFEYDDETGEFKGLLLRRQSNVGAGVRISKTDMASCWETAPEGDACTVISGDRIDPGGPTTASAPVGVNGAAKKRFRGPNLSTTTNIGEALAGHKALHNDSDEHVFSCPNLFCSRVFRSKSVRDKHASFTGYSECSTGDTSRKTTRVADKASFQSTGERVAELAVNARERAGAQVSEAKVEVDNALSNASVAAVASLTSTSEPPRNNAGGGGAGAEPVNVVITSPWFSRELGWAHKSRQQTGKRTIRQLEFVQECYLMGARQKEHKMSARDAASLMKIYGTRAAFDQFARRKNNEFWKVSEPDGLPHFTAAELLHHTVINSLFSGSKSAAVAKFQNMISKAKKKAATVNNAAVGQAATLDNILANLEVDDDGE